ncbi:plant intracellular ras group-related LRR 2 [Striga asiatica]|uniref:Plant intracellular ras group-related LRR 2 n=1 Tax=Striga asiatica TaxID=4170 RepID=A0A5A7RHX5_STRAF|nr:plant intracellular ras group-related LRR 2 [Striga asiatica]
MTSFVTEANRLLKFMTGDEDLDSRLILSTIIELHSSNHTSAYPACLAWAYLRRSHPGFSSPHVRLLQTRPKAHERAQNEATTDRDCYNVSTENVMSGEENCRADGDFRLPEALLEMAASFPLAGRRSSAIFEVGL